MFFNSFALIILHLFHVFANMSTLNSPIYTTTKALPLDHISELALCISKLDKLYRIKNMTTPTEALGDYLGLGFDMLTGESKMAIFDDFYSNCNVTSDFKYIIPDYFRAEKIHIGNVDKSTVIITSMKELAESDSSEKNGGGSGSKGGFSIGGSFSSSSQSTKESLEKKGESMILFKSKILLYRLQGDLNSRFGRAFRGRMAVVVDALKRKLKRTTRFLIEEIYRDYGTHVVLQADLGVKLERQVFISSTLVTASSEKASNFKMGVEGSMKDNEKSGGGKTSFEDEKKESERNEIFKLDHRDVINVWGGPNFEKMYSNRLSDLMSTDNIIALSKDVYLLYRTMHAGALSGLELTEDEVSRLRKMFQNVYNELIERNTYRGCTNTEYHNFDFQANQDDNTCTGSKCDITQPLFKCSIEQTICHPKQAEYFSLLNGLEEKALAEEVTRPSRRKYDRYLQFENELQPFINCETLKFNDKPDKNFFSKANLTEFKACVKQGNIIQTENSYFQKTCDQKIPLEWKSFPLFGGFYQTCSLQPGTKKYINQLEQLNKIRDSPCSRLNVKNSITKDFACPDNTTPELIKTYIHTLPDYIDSMTAGACDYAHGHGCDTYVFQFVLKDTVNISTFWCKARQKNQTSALFFGGAFQRSQPYNSYINAEGCETGMTDVSIFHDSVLCIAHSAIKDKNNENIPELHSIFSSLSLRSYCRNNASKKLITVVDGDSIYACIYKKKGYANSPSVRPVKIPFNDFLEMQESHASSVIITYKVGNESEKEIFELYKINYEIGAFIQSKVNASSTNFMKMSEEEELEHETKNNNGVMINNFTIPLVLASVGLIILLLFVLCLCC